MVNSPVPYPVKMVESGNNNDYDIVIKKDYEQSTSDGPIIINVSNELNLENLQVELKQIIESRFNHLRDSFKSDTHFYDIDVSYTWEEVFEKRSFEKPNENEDALEFGPFDYLRSKEYTWALSQLDYTPGTKTLEIGSLFTFVPFYLAKKGLDVTAIDIDSEAVAYQKQLAEKYNSPFKAEVQDIVKTSYESESFKQVSLISVIEHIPENGDMVAIREIHRILKKNGRLAITVPYDHHWFHSDFGLRPNNYFQRFYNMQSIVTRLVQPPLFEIIDFNFIGGDFIEPGKYKNLGFINPANAMIACISLRKA